MAGKADTLLLRCEAVHVALWQQPVTQTKIHKLNDAETELRVRFR